MKDLTLPASPGSIIKLVRGIRLNSVRSHGLTNAVSSSSGISKHFIMNNFFRWRSSNWLKILCSSSEKPLFAFSVDEPISPVFSKVSAAMWLLAST